MIFSILTFFTVTSIVSIVARTLRGASVRFYITSTSIVAIHCGTGVCNIFSKILKGFSRFDWTIYVCGMSKIEIRLPCSQYCPEYPWGQKHWRSSLWSLAHMPSFSHVKLHSISKMKWQEDVILDIHSIHDNSYILNTSYVIKKLTFLAKDSFVFVGTDAVRRKVFIQITVTIMLTIKACTRVSCKQK